MCSGNPELGEEDSAAQRMNMVVWGDDVETMKAQFEALSEGADVHVPLQDQQWGDMFGGLKDTFGVDWGFNVAPTPRVKKLIECPLISHPR